MREYIITIDESKADPDGGIPIKDKREVVRCRDCKYRRKWKKYWWCEVSALFYSEQIPDGFCAWGVRE